jgi:hypothetical protein
MKNDQPSESDWKKFRTIVPGLRERYLRERNSELSAILQDESLTPTNQFWTASDRIEEIRKILRSCLDGHSRSKMMNFLAIMYRHQMLTESDLNAFSEEILERLERITESQIGHAQQVVDGKPPADPLPPR